MIALLDNLKTHLPFSLLQHTSFLLIGKTAQIAYYPNGTSLIGSSAIADKFFVIIKGSVEARDDEELIDIYHTHDTFGGIELIRNQPSSYEYVVTEELICYEFSKETFLELCNRESRFKEYFVASIATRMEMFQNQKESANVADIMVARVDVLHLREIVEVNADMLVEEALKEMCFHKATAVIVNNEDGYGIVTDANLRAYILDKESKGLSKISQIQSFPLITIEKNELLFNVQLLMTKKSIKHLPVVDSNGNIEGLIEISDILSYFSSQAHLLSSQMDRVKSLDELIESAKKLDAMIRVLHLRGVKARYISRMVSEIHKKMYAKLFDFIFPHEWKEGATLIVLGSEGRGEQIVRTDQDNALIFKDDFNPKEVEKYTQRFIEALDKIGFPRCEGNVMVINPKWAKSLSEYKRSIREYIDTPSGENMIDLAIFYDAFRVAGNLSLFLELRDYLMMQVKSNKIFLAHFTKSIESFDSPIGLFSRFLSTKGHEHEIDIKKGAVFAMVHGVRALALEYSITKTNTTERIKMLNDKGYFTKERATNLIETLEILNNIRLHFQLFKIEHQEPIDNYINWKKLSKIEQDTLKEAIKEVEQFKKELLYHFKVNLVS